MVGNIPKCDETHPWRQKPEKKCQKRNYTPSIYTLHAKNRKILNFSNNPETVRNIQKSC